MELLVLLFVCSVAVLGSPYENKVLEKKLMDFLLRRNEPEFADPRKCIDTDANDLLVSSHDTPSPATINQCNDGGLYENEEECEYFDTEMCSTVCVFGYTTNDKGCVESCDCEKEGLFQGDVMLTKKQIMDMQDDSQNRAATKVHKLWNNIPTGKGTYIVPFTLASNIVGSPRAVASISAAMEEYAKQTCIRFKPRVDEEDYLEIFQGKGCYSYIGRNGRKQPISIGHRCEYKGVVMHELMHAMGFWHEHARPDRDEVVSIIRENINSKYLSNFYKKKKSYIDSMGSPYDIGSIMQYGGYFFSKNRRPTIIVRKTGKPVKSQRNGFSVEDVKQLNSLYRCRKSRRRHGQVKDKSFMQ